MKPSLLQRAISLAVEAHREFEDPPGEPYIVHPMRVMLAVSNVADFEQDEHLRCAAILHDVLERTSLTRRDLKAAKMPLAVIEAVELLTHSKSQRYADYVIALKPNRLSRLVKLADLADNADLRHVPMRASHFAKDAARPVRYILSHRYLLDAIEQSAYREAMSRFE